MMPAPKRSSPGSSARRSARRVRLPDEPAAEPTKLSTVPASCTGRVPNRVTTLEATTAADRGEPHRQELHAGGQRRVAAHLLQEDRGEEEHRRGSWRR